MPTPNKPAPTPENLVNSVPALESDGFEHLIAITHFDEAIDRFTEVPENVRDELKRITRVLGVDREGITAVSTTRLGISFAIKSSFRLGSAEFTALHELLEKINRLTVILPNGNAIS